MTKPDWQLVMEKKVLDKFSGCIKIYMTDGKVTAYQPIPATIKLTGVDLALLQDKN